jgi:hypothetical protein
MLPPCKRRIEKCPGCNRNSKFHDQYGAYLCPKCNKFFDVPYEGSEHLDVANNKFIYSSKKQFATMKLFIYQMR